MQWNFHKKTQWELLKEQVLYDRSAGGVVLGFPSFQCFFPQLGFTCTAFSFRAMSWGWLKPLTAPRRSTFLMNVSSSMQSRCWGAQQALASPNLKMSSEEGTSTPWQPENREMQGRNREREFQEMLVCFSIEINNILLQSSLSIRGSTVYKLTAGTQKPVWIPFLPFLANYLVAKSWKCQCFAQPHAQSRAQSRVMELYNITARLQIALRAAGAGGEEFWL